MSGRQFARYNSNQGTIYGISFSPDGQCFATAGQDGIVKLWRVEGLDELLKKGRDWLKNYFVTHPEALKKLEVCQILPLTPATPTRQHLVTTTLNKPGEGFVGEFLVHDKLVRIYQGDITNLVTDVIVSSDGTYLQMSGGVSWRILQVGGNKIYKETRGLIPLSLGDVAVTTAGKLQAKKIFHGVVIDRRIDIFPFQDVIRQVVHTCLEKANQYGLHSIAFPLLGTGAGCFSVQAVWEMTLRQIIRDLSTETQSIAEVIVVVYERRLPEELDVKGFLEKIEKSGWRSLL